MQSARSEGSWEFVPLARAVDRLSHPTCNLILKTSVPSLCTEVNVVAYWLPVTGSEIKIQIIDCVANTPAGWHTLKLTHPQTPLATLESRLDFTQPAVQTFFLNRHIFWLFSIFYLFFKSFVLVRDTQAHKGPVKWNCFKLICSVLIRIILACQHYFLEFLHYCRSIMCFTLDTCLEINEKSTKVENLVLFISTWLSTIF